MWNCIACGCRAIAHGLGSCPHCFEHKDAPKVAVDASADYEAKAEEAPESVRKKA